MRPKKFGLVFCNSRRSKITFLKITFLFGFLSESNFSKTNLPGKLTSWSDTTGKDLFLDENLQSKKDAIIIDLWCLHLLVTLVQGTMTVSFLPLSEDLVQFSQNIQKRRAVLSRNLLISKLIE